MVKIWDCIWTPRFNSDPLFPHHAPSPVRSSQRWASVGGATAAQVHRWRFPWKWVKVERKEKKQQPVVLWLHTPSRRLCLSAAHRSTAPGVTVLIRQKDSKSTDKLKIGESHLNSEHMRRSVWCFSRPVCLGQLLLDGFKFCLSFFIICLCIRELFGTCS